ncbi:MAG: YraN family protein [Myxococcota bacterium]
MPTPGPDPGAARDARRALGARGEARAAAHLERRGYRILARNVRAGGVELDLVARRGALVVFVEVKTRRGSRHGAPVEAVDAHKQARLARGAAAWLHAERAGLARGCRRARFDVVACVEHADGHHSIAHWPGAFDAP